MAVDAAAMMYQELDFVLHMHDRLLSVLIFLAVQLHDSNGESTGRISS